MREQNPHNCSRAQMQTTDKIRKLGEMKIPDEVLAVAQACRATFGPATRLRFLATADGVQGDHVLDGSIGELWNVAPAREAAIASGAIR